MSESSPKAPRSPTVGAASGAPAPIAAGGDDPATPLLQGIPDSGLTGPFPVGEYAAALRSKLRSFTHVQIVGELVNLRLSRARVYFELRDASGALPCAVWRRDWDVMLARAGEA